MSFKCDYFVLDFTLFLCHLKVPGLKTGLLFYMTLAIYSSSIITTIHS